MLWQGRKNCRLRLRLHQSAEHAQGAARENASSDRFTRIYGFSGARACLVIARYQGMPQVPVDRHFVDPMTARQPCRHSHPSDSIHHRFCRTFLNDTVEQTNCPRLLGSEIPSPMRALFADIPNHPHWLLDSLRSPILISPQRLFQHAAEVAFGANHWIKLPQRREKERETGV